MRGGFTCGVNEVTDENIDQGNYVLEQTSVSLLCKLPVYKSSLHLHGTPGQMENWFLTINDAYMKFCESHIEKTMMKSEHINGVL